MIDYYSLLENINQRLNVYYDEKIQQASLLDQGYSDFWKIIKQVSLSGGKRLRPYLVILSYLAYGGINYSSVIDVAVAQELLHIALLIHDDVIDRDYFRHNQPNIAGYKQVDYEKLTSKKESFHLADSVSILAGDLLLSGAYELTYSSKISELNKKMAIEVINNSFFEVAAGEFLDVESVLKQYSIGDSLKVARYKTSSYSFVYPLILGSNLGKLNHSDSELIKEFGYSLGTAYQLIDDIDGLFGDQKITGKSNLSDIREAKRTYLMAVTFKNCNENQLDKLEKILGRDDVNNDDLIIVQEIVRLSGSLDETIMKINKLIKISNDCLSRMSIDKKYIKYFDNLIADITKRIS